RRALRAAAQNQQRTLPPPGEPAARRASIELEGSEPPASALHALAGSTAPAQQGQGSRGPRTVRLHLGLAPHPELLSTPKQQYRRLKPGPDTGPQKKTKTKTKTKKL